MSVTTDKISSIFFQYAIPSVLGMIAVSSAGIVDGFFIGNFVGSHGLAAVNISLPVFALLFGLSLMLAIGSSVVSGKLMGQGATKSASNIFTKAFLSIGVFSVAICALLFVNIDTILHLFGATPELAEVAIQYLSVMLPFMPFFMIGIVLNYFVKVDSRPMLAFAALLVVAAINIVLDWYLIAYLSLGIFGAALATGLSYLSLIVVLLPHFFSKKATLRFVKPIGGYIEIVKASWNGASEFVNEISVGITTLIFNLIMIKTFGVEGVAAFAVINYILWIGVMISFGISDSLQPIISKNYGARKPQRIEGFLKLAFFCVTAAGLVMALLITTIPSDLVSIFLKDNEQQTVQIVLEFASLIWPAFLFIGINLTISAYFTAMHKPIQSATIAILRSLVLPLFFISTLPLIFGTNGIFLAIPVAELVTFVVAVFLFKRASPRKTV